MEWSGVERGERGDGTKWGGMGWGAMQLDDHKYKKSTATHAWYEYSNKWVVRENMKTSARLIHTARYKNIRPLLLGPMVYTKTYIFNHFYRHYLVLLSMVPRNSTW